jgi:hypothetical protein
LRSFKQRLALADESFHQKIVLLPSFCDKFVLKLLIRYQRANSCNVCQVTQNGSQLWFVFTKDLTQLRGYWKRKKSELPLSHAGHAYLTIHFDLLHVAVITNLATTT